METFVAHNSIVRKIWGSADIVLFIFAGAAAEFALNKSVDWLYFTGKLPKDPIGRMFSTVEYAHRIIFMEKAKALASIDHITMIHKAVEEKRGSSIPDWAYRDVLFLLIYYSISAYEMTERKMTLDEKEEVFAVFSRVGQRMGLQQLPENYAAWLVARRQHLHNNLERSHFSTDLFFQYKKQLKPLRYWTMLQVQAYTTPVKVQQLLLLRSHILFKPFMSLYRVFRSSLTNKYLLPLLLPAVYKVPIRNINKHL